MNIFLLYGLLMSVSTNAQSLIKNEDKPVITTEAFGKFASVSSPSLSTDGNYAMYSINDPLGNTGGSYIKAIHGDWQSEKVGYGQFTIDSRYFIYMHSGDSLAFLDLQNKRTAFIAGASSYRQAGKQVAWILKREGKLIVRNIETNKENAYEGINDYCFSNDGTRLLIVSTADKGITLLQLINLANSKRSFIWTSDNIENMAGRFTFSKTGNAVAFIVENKSGKTLWYFNESTEKAVMIADDHTEGISENLLIDGIDFRGFTGDGKKIMLTLKERVKQKPGDGVDVWSYNDATLQSQQLKQLKPKTYVGIAEIERKRVVLSESANDKILSLNDQYVIIGNNKGGLNSDEWYWNRSASISIYLASLKEGTRKLINDNLPIIFTTSYWLSPGGKYVVYYDAGFKNYFSYEIETGIKRNITKVIKTLWTSYAKKDIGMAPYMGAVGMHGGWIPCGWVGKDSAVLLYDQNDIYQVDLTARSTPINLTNGVGKESNIEFRSAIENSSQILNAGDQLIVSAFNRKNKNDGFYRITIGQRNPELLISQPFIYKGTWEDERFIPMQPIKAANSNVYLIRRMSAEESPNFFWTRDFKTFSRITDVRPEKRFNWLSTELITWKLPDGSTSQGVLYKPENFDATKKYPVIFHYYERMSESLHGFMNPDVSRGDLNIPYFVSNGYLVFTPDIHYTIGHPGQSVVNTMVSAVTHLSKLSYIDSKHIGIQGHSRGGWETNFIITHTNLFAAATSASGFCNYTSLFDGVRFLGSGVTRHAAYEKFYQRIGATLWEKPELYIENSPIFLADKITTPVLMMANKDDDDVPFEQGVEFFTALRRLGKKAWMLQYDGEGHMVFDKAAEDFTIRMKQFFDHYLKGAPAPKWMIEGIPASKKGIDDGLRLVEKKDKNGKWVTPGQGLLKTNLEK